MQIRRLVRGQQPLLISLPHIGTFLPPDIKERLSHEGLRLPDTDWHLDRLYDFAEGMGVGLLMATHSRYVIDLNRPQDDAGLYPGQIKTGLCPVETFDGKNIYKRDEEPDNIEKVNRIGAYWMPYHDTLQAEIARLKQEHGYAILYDAHSIRSRIPRLFDGALPDLSLGTVNGASCAPDMAARALAAASSGAYSSVLNGRFIGGYITREYGRPAQHVHAIQVELACRNYMDEDLTFRYDGTLAASLQKTLRDVVESLLSWGRESYA